MDAQIKQALLEIEDYVLREKLEAFIQDAINFAYEEGYETGERASDFDEGYDQGFHDGKAAAND